MGPIQGHGAMCGELIPLARDAHPGSHFPWLVGGEGHGKQTHLRKLRLILMPRKDLTHL